MSLRDDERLYGVHPKLQAAVHSILLKLPMFVIEGVRTDARQQDLYAQGRTRSGPIVTYKNGTSHKSNHQPHADGLGYAIDMAWKGPEPFAETHPWQTYGELVEASGLIWGGRWTMHDLPHAELPT